MFVKAVSHIHCRGYMAFCLPDLAEQTLCFFFSNADRFTDLLHRQDTTAELATIGVFGLVVRATD